MSKKKLIYLVAGEPSGDFLGSEIISNLIKDKKPITTSPIAKDEWAKRPNNASPGKFVLFWSCINVNAIKDEIINTENAILNSMV